MLYLVRRSTSWQLKKWRSIPIRDLDLLLTGEAISASLLRLRELNDPRYLKCSVKWMHFSFGRFMLLGAVLSFLCLLASLTDVGKNIASVFDLFF